MKQTFAPSRRRAFTLIEVLMVVLIVAITAAVAVPMLTRDHATKLRAAADMFVADLAYAQIESITHGDDPRVVVFDTTNHAYSIAPADDTANPITNPVGGQPYKVTFGVGVAKSLNTVTIQAVSVGGDDQLGFGTYGELDQTADATVTLAAGGNTVVITINAVNGEATIGNVN